MVASGNPDIASDLQHTTIHGRQVAYRLAGRGPLVVLIHGLAGSSQTWEPVIGGLAEHCTVLAPDLPGHGDSAKPFDGDYSLGGLASSVRDLIAALGYERATIVGQSLGGGVAMQFAYQFPTWCERLVLVGSGGLGREVSPLLRVLAVPGLEHLFPVVLNGPVRDAGRVVLAGLARVGLHPSAYLNEIWRSFESLADPETREAFVRTMQAVIDVGGQRVSAHDRLPLARDIPTLIIWGSRDAIIPCRHAAAAHETLPSSRVEIFEGVGHYPHCEDPERFLDVLVEFIATTVPADLTHRSFAQALGHTGSGASA
jgi:pimeloyl-ACP methyl ester carboxylesterase